MDASEAKAADRHHADREELAERIAAAVPRDGTLEPIAGLVLTRASRPTEPVYGLSTTALCVIAQGSKEISLGEDRLRYDPAHYLLVTIELPVAAQVVEATEETPYLGLRLDLDAVLVGSVLVEAGLPGPQPTADARAVSVSPIDSGLLDAAVRLVRLVDRPEERRVLAPLITREIVFRLLIGEQGGRLRHLVALGGSAQRIAQAVDKIRSSFDRPLRIDRLASEFGMSTSGFHHHFKAVTAMTPLQFQKQLRLHEARRIMLGEDIDAATAGYRVGYEDAAHFNREYKRLFGLPPMRDVGRLRGQTVSASVD